MIAPILSFAMVAQTVASVPGPAGTVCLVVTGTAQDSPGFDQSLVRTTQAALSLAGLDYVAPPAQPLEEIKFTLGCAQLDASCAASLGQSVSAQTVVLANVLEVPGPGVTYTIVDVAARQRIHVGAVSLARHDMVGAQTAAAAIVRDLGAPARLTVRSQPSGASVHIDGDHHGETPLVLSGGLEAGPHAVTLLFPDGYQLTQNVVMRRGDDVVIDGARQMSASAGLSPARVVGWSLVGAAMVTAATGVVLGGLAFAAQDRYLSEHVVDGVAVRDLSRAEAKALSRELDGYIVGTEVAFGASLALALGSAVVFGVID